MRKAPDRIYDELLVLRSQDGEMDALEELARRWQLKLLRHAWRLTGREDAARDVLQETWMAIVKGIRRLSDPAAFPVWAYGIASRKCADWTRHQIRRRRLDESTRNKAGETPTADPALAHGDDEIALLHAALGDLPPESRAILALRYLEDLSTSSIAEIMSLPVGTVKSRLHSAREQLKTLLERIQI